MIDVKIYKDALKRGKLINALNQIMREEATDCLIFEKFHKKTGQSIRCSSRK